MPTLQQIFNEDFYLTNNPDVAAAIAAGTFANALEHYQQFGQNEQRDPSSTFSFSAYTAANQDVVDSGTNALDHFLNNGFDEGRSGLGLSTDVFDPNAYLAANQDVADAIANGNFLNALEHAILHGFGEGRTDGLNSNLSSSSDFTNALSGGNTGSLRDVLINNSNSGTSSDNNGTSNDTTDNDGSSGSTNSGTGVLSVGNSGPAAINGTAGNDSLTGSENTDDVINGLGGDDTLRGSDLRSKNAGDDTLNGGDGDDLIQSDSGDNSLNGGDGNDTIFGGSDNDNVDGGDGDDSISTASGNDTIVAGNGADTIRAGQGADTITLNTDATTDQIRFTSATDGNNVGSLAAASADDINGFEVGTDDIAFSVGDLGLNGGGAAVISAVTSGMVASAGNRAVVHISNATANDLTNLTDVQTAIGNFVVMAAGARMAFTVNNTANTETGIYFFIDDGNGNNTLASGEIGLMGIVDGQLGTGDLALI